MFRKLGTLVIGAALGLLAACNPIAVLDGANEAVAEFHERAAAGDIETIYRDSTEEFKESTSLKLLEQVLADQQRVSGMVESTEREGFSINTNNGVTSATITMATDFEFLAGTETFVFQGNGDDWLLQNYSYQAEPYEGETDQEAPVTEKPSGEAAVEGKPSDQPLSADELI